jgi:hypothetical protein
MTNAPHDHEHAHHVHHGTDHPSHHGDAHHHGDDHHNGDDHREGHEQRHDHEQHAMGDNLSAMAASATLHCLTGCAIGEILGLIIGTALGLATVPTIVLAVALAFLFGYTLSTLPLLRAGLGFFAALSIVLAADTLSIATMEVVDNAVMAGIPGAMEAGLVNVVFWVGMIVALTAAFVAAYPVNRYLLQRGKGHALTHHYQHGRSEPTDWRRRIPAFSPGSLVAVIVAFLLGGLVVAWAGESAPTEHSASDATAQGPRS